MLLSDPFKEERALAEQLEADAAIARALQDEEEALAAKRPKQPTPLPPPEADAAYARALQDKEEQELAAKRHKLAPPPSARANSPPSAAAKPPAAKPPAAAPQIVIDGLNVGRDINFRGSEFDPASVVHGYGGKPIYAAAIKTAIDFYLGAGYGVAAFLPEWCMEGGKCGSMYAVGHELLRPYQEQGILVLTPARIDDDNFILDHAEKTEGCTILTNDHFNKQVASGRIDAAWRDERIVKFLFVQNELRPQQYKRKI